MEKMQGGKYIYCLAELVRHRLMSVPEAILDYHEKMDELKAHRELAAKFPLDFLDAPKTNEPPVGGISLRLDEADGQEALQDAELSGHATDDVEFWGGNTQSLEIIPEIIYERQFDNGERYPHVDPQDNEN